MSDRCAWPRCREPSTGAICGKWLCDKHAALMVYDKMRNKVGLPPMEKGGRVLPFGEMVVCGMADCDRWATSERDGKFVCTTHHHDYKRAGESEKFEEETGDTLEDIEALLEGGAFDWSD